jgi:glyoxylase-like metal-dependent hydrolase (beta-lactamase superfamily II)
MSRAFTVGGIECRLLLDGAGGLPPDVLFANAPADERDAALGDRVGADGRVPAPFGCLLIRADGRVVLVDTGIGGYEHPLGGSGGELDQALAEENLHPRDVDIVVVTHGHLDHIGGLCEDGEPRFSSATHVMSRREWELWTDEARLAEMPEVAAEVARAQLPPLARTGLLELVDGPHELLPGIVVVEAPGHSPGQLVVQIGDGAAFLADVVLDQLHVVHPEWVMTFEPDSAQVEQSRRDLLGRAADARWTVGASHLPEVGQVERAAGGFRLVSPSPSPP